MRKPKEKMITFLQILEAVALTDEKLSFSPQILERVEFIAKLLETGYLASLPT